MNLPTEIWEIIEDYEQMYAKAQHMYRYQSCMSVVRHFGRIFPYYESLAMYANCIDLIIMIAEREVDEPIQSLSTLYQKQCQ